VLLVNTDLVKITGPADAMAPPNFALLDLKMELCTMLLPNITVPDGSANLSMLIAPPVSA
jgi:hypothetical protein